MTGPVKIGITRGDHACFSTCGNEPSETNVNTHTPKASRHQTITFAGTKKAPPGGGAFLPRRVNRQAVDNDPPLTANFCTSCFFVVLRYRTVYEKKPALLTIH
jgi:uncharacterized protein YneF (UPF0154 family)